MNLWGGGNLTPTQIYSKGLTQTVEQATNKAKLFTNVTTSYGNVVITINGSAITTPALTQKASWGNDYGFFLSDEIDLDLNVGDTVVLTQGSGVSYAPTLICYNG